MGKVRRDAIARHRASTLPGVAACRTPQRYLPIAGLAPPQRLAGMHCRGIPHLLECSAAVRFLSCEPLLGAVDLFCEVDIRGGVTSNALKREPGISWVICGCESGPCRREWKLEWDQAIERQCREAGVPFFRKQIIVNDRVSKDMAEWPAELRTREIPELKA